jgi:predicted Zn-ribbon and HTH transcriptional regulator
LFLDLGLTLQNGVFRKGAVKLTSKEALRAQFTPPDGKTPKSGVNWDKAKAAALAFNALFQDPLLDLIQESFFLSELRSEAALKRPKMNNTSINSILYPKGWPAAGTAAILPDDAARSLFFSVWQNSPRTAETYLYAVNSSGSFAKDPKNFTSRLARKFAESNFGNWGIYKAALCSKCGFQNKPKTTKCAKCKAALREARYTKIVKCVNKLMGAGTLPPVP